MLRRAILQAQRPAVASAARWISHSRVLGGGQTTMASMLGSHTGSDVPTADYLMTVEQTMELMAKMHLEALPIVENDKVVGVFTEHDYFDKVLSSGHSAVRSSKVCEVATMGARLIVAYPEDTVEGCLEVMTKKNLSAIPVVEHDGHVMGTVSMRDLAKEMFETQDPAMESSGPAVKSSEPTMKAHGRKMDFSAPSHFPENITAAGGGFHDDITASMTPPEKLQELYDQLKHDLEASSQLPAKPSFDSTAAERFMLDPNLEEMAAGSFSEASTFPEYTPSEDGLFTQTHGVPPANAADVHNMTETEILEQEKRYMMAQSKLLDEIHHFSEPSDFPEVLPIEEMIAARKREELSS